MSLPRGAAVAPLIDRVHDRPTIHAVPRAAERRRLALQREDIAGAVVAAEDDHVVLRKIRELQRAPDDEIAGLVERTERIARNRHAPDDAVADRIAERERATEIAGRSCEPGGAGA